MLIETLLSSLGGGILRTVPEVLGLLQKKDDNKHELAMLEAQFKLETLKQQGQQAAAELKADVDQMLAAISAQSEALKGQMQLTGFRLVDTLNMLVRPVITYWLIALYSAVKVSTMMVAVEQANVWVSIKECWTEDDAAMMAGVFTFWFVGRVWDKQRK